jgi:4-hydroxybenzoate polyprenyltransferase/phosphoserine phosphatase
MHENLMNASSAPSPALGQPSASARIVPVATILLPPLVVDLDGTLIKTNLLLESVCSLLRQEPLALFALPIWLLKGRAHLKREIAQRVQFDPALLPYRTELLDYLRAEHDKGRAIILATASDERFARNVADHLKVFDMVVASDGITNLAAERKRARLVAEFGEKGFDYVGDESRDLAVWSSARNAIVVSPSPRLKQAVVKVSQFQRAFEEPGASVAEYLTALRPQQWLKNILVFVPLFSAHLFTEPILLIRTIIAFVAFCCCASSGYLVNDLCDLPADRHHPSKRLRPFASGRLPLAYGFAMAPVLAILGCLLAGLLSGLSLGIVMLYFIIAAAYSLSLKKVVLLDVFTLASLYTLRIIEGGLAAAVPLSVWLLAFSMFLFLSLAFIKRYAELAIMRSVDGEHAKARSYELGDAELLVIKGMASGYAAVLVLSLYIASGSVRPLYSTHQVLWLVCPLLLYWIGYLWLVAHRGKMYHDPLVFAVRDRTSRILILLMLAAALIAI